MIKERKHLFKYIVILNTRTHACITFTQVARDLININTETGKQCTPHKKNTRLSKMQICQERKNKKKKKKNIHQHNDEIITTAKKTNITRRN